MRLTAGWTSSKVHGCRRDTLLLMMRGESWGSGWEGNKGKDWQYIKNRERVWGSRSANLILLLWWESAHFHFNRYCNGRWNSFLKLQCCCFLQKPTNKSPAMISKTRVEKDKYVPVFNRLNTRYKHVRLCNCDLRLIGLIGQWFWSNITRGCMRPVL